MLALPALWYGGLSIGLAALPLVGARTWSDVLRVAGDARVQLADWRTYVALGPRAAGGS
jgi:hypothetical protein